MTDKERISALEAEVKRLWEALDCLTRSIGEDNYRRSMNDSVQYQQLANMGWWR